MNFSNEQPWDVIFARENLRKRGAHMWHIVATRINGLREFKLPVRISRSYFLPWLAHLDPKAE